MVPSPSVWGSRIDPTCAKSQVAHVSTVRRLGNSDELLRRPVVVESLFLFVPGGIGLIAVVAAAVIPVHHELQRIVLEIPAEIAALILVYVRIVEALHGKQQVPARRVPPQPDPVVQVEGIV